MLHLSCMSDHENKSWRFLSNHTQVLLCISQDPDARLREIAQTVEITERAAHRIITDLIESGYVERLRVGRRNRYLVNPEVAMRHPAQHGQEVGALLKLLGITEPRGEQTTPRSRSRRGVTSNTRLAAPPKDDETEPSGTPLGEQSPSYRPHDRPYKGNHR